MQVRILKRAVQVLKEGLHPMASVLRTDHRGAGHRGKEYRVGVQNTHSQQKLKEASHLP